MTAGNRKHPTRRHPGPARPDGGPLAWLMLLAAAGLLLAALVALAWTVLPDVVLAFWPIWAALAVTGATALVN